MHTKVLSQDLIRVASVRRGRQLEYPTIVWNSLEAIISVGAGVIAGSIAR